MTRITKCDSTQIVHLALDNKSKQDQNIKVFVQVLKSKDSDKSFAKLIQYKASGLKITKSTCENSIPALQLSLPPDYDPEQIIFKTITQAY
ncbi:MAG: hypothetical protein H7Y13_09830 [Sphingobacteriaceae bacterium]|nr:hypothetical protein [Sphingobacteriaceae bacterium]